jgi:hypothetical protein
VTRDSDERAFEAEESGASEVAIRVAWSQLSARSFALDWDSEEDRDYDRLAPG